MLSQTLKKFAFSKLLIRNITRNFATATDKMPVMDGKPSHDSSTNSSTGSVQPWVDIENRLSKLRGELVLSEHDKIENYVLGVIKGYFRTTYKDGIHLDSNLSEHGLDSLDAIELAMVLEDELGKELYIIKDTSSKLR